MKIKKENNKKTEFLYDLAKKISYICIIFSILVSALILKNFIQLNTLDPINDTQLKELIKKSQLEPKNKELKKFIRELDLLIRKAYFSSLAFNKFGTYLLLGSIILLLISIKVMNDLKKSLPKPDKFQEIQDRPKVFILLQKSVIIFAGLIVSSAILLPLIFQNSFNQYLDKEYKTERTQKAAFASKEEMLKNWPSFRGYNGLGHAYASNVPEKWHGPKNKNIDWIFKIPKPGFNSPIIWDNYIFISGGNKEAREIYCIDKNTGQLLWKKSTGSKNIEMPKVAEDTGLAAPTMATNGKLVFAIFATGELICTDFNGNIQWQKKLPLPSNHYGHSSSLYTFKHLLLVQYDHNKGSQVIALNPTDGGIVWQKKREVEVVWTSPILIDYEGNPELILTATPYVISYDPVTGKENWKMKDVISGEIGSSAAYSKGVVFFANQFSKLAAVSLKTKKIIWEYDDDLPDASSPVAYNKYLIVPTSFGKVTTMEAMTGKILWEYKFKTGFYASPIIADNKIYLLDKKGIMHIIELSKKFKLISSSPLGEDTVATPAIENNRIYIRGVQHLYSISKKNE